MSLVLFALMRGSCGRGTATARRQVYGDFTVYKQSTKLAVKRLILRILNALSERMMSIPISALTIIIPAVLLYYAVKCLSIGRRPKDLPPGPPTIPLLGNIHLVSVLPSLKDGILTDLDK